MVLRRLSLTMSAKPKKCRLASKRFMKNVTWRLYYFVNVLQWAKLRYYSYYEYLRDRNIIRGFCTLKA
jgi:hypothetical protein